MNSSYKKQSKAIRDLIHHAGKGNLFSLYELYENYTSGKYVEEKSPDLAQKYLTELVLTLSNTKLQIESLNFREFRRFKSFDIKFDPQLTVIIGENGAGKTSIADALVKNLSWISANLLKSQGVGKYLSETDINVNVDDYAEVIGRFKLNRESGFDISLATPKAGYPGKVTNTVIESKKIGDIYRLSAEKVSSVLPLFAFYSVERSNINLTANSAKDRFNSRFNALKDGLDASTHLETFSEKYIELFNLAEAEETQEIREVKQSIKLLLELVENDQNNEKKNSSLLNRLALEQNNLSDLISAGTFKYQKIINSVNDAIETLVPDVKRIKVDRSTGKSVIILENFGNAVNIRQLSQGQKTLVALTGDLALRLATLNPDAENTLLGQGIVIIDEVELHLHPRWQQQILLKLQGTFPNIQFIVTTHSPHVLSTVDMKYIRMLKFEDNGKAFVEMPEYQTKGVNSSDILERIMGVFSVPLVDEANWLRDYSALISEGKWESEKAQDLYKKLIEHFGEQHPEILMLNSEIRVQEFKRKAQQLKRKG